MTQPALPRDGLLQPVLPDPATFKIVGLGGVGGIVARYLAMFLAAQDRAARLIFIDGDQFEPSNATRMFFGQCGNKAAVTREELLPRFADSSLTLIAIEEYLTPENMHRLVGEGDVVILAVDNHATRKLASDHCGRLRNVCLISGGNDGIETPSDGPARRGTFGNAQIYLRQQGEDASPSLARYHAEIKSPMDRLPTDRGCADLVASVPQILFTNLTTAAAILNTLWLHLCGARHYGELVFDIAEGLMRPCQVQPP